MPFNWFNNQNAQGNQNPNQNNQNTQNNQQQQQPDPPQPAPTGLDKFASLVDNANNPQNAGEKKAPLNVNELFQNPQFLSGLKSNLRTSLQSSVSPETRQKLESNDPDALLSLVTDVAEASYMQALQHSASLQNLAMDERFTEFSSNTENLVGKRIQDQQYYSAIPQLQNPIVQLGIQSFVDKVREQNPTITPDEMKSQINEYVSALGKDLGAIEEPESEEQRKAEQGIDWFQELGMEPPPQQT